jgi:hypothetical protein
VWNRRTDRKPRDLEAGRQIDQRDATAAAIGNDERAGLLRGNRYRDDPGSAQPAEPSRSKHPTSPFSARIVRLIRAAPSITIAVLGGGGRPPRQYREKPDAHQEATIAAERSTWPSGRKSVEKKARHLRGSAAPDQIESLSGDAGPVMPRRSRRR